MIAYACNKCGIQIEAPEAVLDNYNVCHYCKNTQKITKSDLLDSIYVLEVVDSKSPIVTQWDEIRDSVKLLALLIPAAALPVCLLIAIREQSIIATLISIVLIIPIVKWYIETYPAQARSAANTAIGATRTTA